MLGLNIDTIMLPELILCIFIIQMHTQQKKKNTYMMNKIENFKK